MITAFGTLFALSPIILCLIIWLLIDGLHQTVKIYRHERMRVYLGTPIPLIVTARDEPSPGYIRLALERTDNKSLPACFPGQYLTLLTALESDKPPVRRAYSLAGWSPDFKQYELGIKHEESGKVSTWVWQHLMPGVSLSALPPTGRFYLPAPPGKKERLILVAGGIGITPLRAMLDYLKNCRNLAKDSVWLFHSAREENQLLWREEFELLAKNSNWFQYRPVLSNPPDNWPGKRGRLTTRHLLMHAINPLRAEFYFCANNEMIASLCAGLESAGIPTSRLHYESFGLVTHSTGAAPARLDIAGFGEAFYDGEPNLLIALEYAGISMEATCRAGECGGCVMKLLAGTVQTIIQPHISLPPQQILTCCCVPTSNLRLAHAYHS